MSNENTTAPTTSGDIEAAVRAGRESQRLDRCLDFKDGEIPVALVGPGQCIHVLKDFIEVRDARAAAPRRRMGTAHHSQRDSFIEHVKRFKCPNTTVWADIAKMRLTAIFDYHPAGPEVAEAAWGGHRSTYECPRSSAWLLWCAKDEIMQSQDDFAEFIDSRFDDLTGGDGYPEPAAILEMARSLQIHTKGTFERRVDPTTGAYRLISKEEHESTSTAIPRAFAIGVPIFEGGELWRVEVRLALRVRGGSAAFGYTLHRRVELEREAFDEVRKVVAEQTDLPVFAGTPE